MVVVIMGVTSSGKSTIGRGVADAMGWEFADGDDFHPPSNVAKMKSGQPLNDDDRAPWLGAIRRHMDQIHASGKGGVIACSALKDSYRRILGNGMPLIRFVHLHGSQTLLAERIAARKGHFMPPTLLASQLATLEPPKDAWVVDIARSPAEIIRDLVDKIRREAPAASH